MDATTASSGMVFSSSVAGLPPASISQSARGLSAPFQAVPYGVEITNRVFVGGCPYNMTELEMMQFFSKFGEVLDAKIITDRDGGKSKGYGFVTFATEEQAASVYSKGSIYYDQKKLNVAKAIRKYGGQYQKANQEYVNGQRLVWLHPSGYLMTQQQEGGWQVDNFPVQTQPVKAMQAFYSALLPPQTSGSAGVGYPPMPYMQQPYMGYTPMQGVYSNPYGYPDSTSVNMPPDSTSVYTPPYSDEQAVSVISTTTASSGHESLESSSSSHTAPPPPAGREVLFDMKALEVKTKQLSLDSAYTSEADLDSSHNTTAANSGTTSPKETYDIIEESCDNSSTHSVPTSPGQTHKEKSQQELTGTQQQSVPGVNKPVSEETGQ